VCCPRGTSRTLVSSKVGSPPERSASSEWHMRSNLPLLAPTLPPCADGQRMAGTASDRSREDAAGPCATVPA
jgi:hypothetical protein